VRSCLSFLIRFFYFLHVLSHVPRSLSYFDSTSSRHQFRDACTYSRNKFAGYTKQADYHILDTSPHNIRVPFIYLWPDLCRRYNNLRDNDHLVTHNKLSVTGRTMTLPILKKRRIPYALKCPLIFC
jgi:hypothetical protein